MPCEWRIAFILLINSMLSRTPITSSLLAETDTNCFTHEDCVHPSYFCAWVDCFDENGNPLRCGRCRPCEECICDINSADFQCPTFKCPAQPIDAVRFLQGAFHNHSDLAQAPGYQCVRRLVITGNMFAMQQLPVYTLHPADLAIFNETGLVFSGCPSYSRSGLLRNSQTMANNGLKLDAIMSSEGTSELH
jgi:hypothetical protein